MKYAVVQIYTVYFKADEAYAWGIAQPAHQTMIQAVSDCTSLLNANYNKVGFTALLKPYLPACRAPIYNTLYLQNLQKYRASRRAAEAR